MSNKESPSYISVDWGTSSLRIYLCDDESNPLDYMTGSGVKHTTDFESTIFGLIGKWIDRYGNLPVLMSGMVGSTIGWKPAAYVDLPATKSEIFAKSLRFESRGTKFVILPGLKTNNIFNQPDLIRGEETQIIGYLKLRDSAIGKGNQILCMPGTHVKWVKLEDESIKTFFTGFQGEFFEILKNHSTLITKGSIDSFDFDKFKEGIKLAYESNSGHLIHLLFSVRANQVVGKLDPSSAHAFLSGILIGAEIASALSIFTELKTAVLIGAVKLNKLYQLAFELFDIKSESVDGNEASMNGISSYYEDCIR